MNEVQIFSKPEFGRIGVLTAEDGTPWFNAVDVCRVLGYGNVTAALRKHVKEKDLTKCETLTSGWKQKVNFVNEADLRITETKQNGKLRKVNFVDEADTCKQRIRSGGQMREVNFVNEADVRKTDIRSGGQVRKVNFVDEADLRITETIRSKLPTDASEQGGWDRVHNAGDLAA